MLRFLRKYNKMILVVAGVILMVLWLLPQAMHTLGNNNPANQVVFRIAGRTYYGRDYVRAQGEVMALTALQQTARAPVLPIQIESIEHWMMLVHEAERMGLVGGGTRGQEMLVHLANAAAQMTRTGGASEEEVAKFQEQIRTQTLARLEETFEAKRAELGPDRMEQAIARIYGVRRMIELRAGALTFSTLEAANVAMRNIDTALVDLSLADYREMLGEAGEPTPEQVQEHFAKYRDVEAARDGSTIGYRLTPAVSYETVEIDLARVRNGLTVDEIEVNKRWRQNKAAYGENFATAKAQVDSDIRDERLGALVHALEEIAHRELLRETKGLESDGAFKKLPPNWDQTRAPFQHIADLANAEVAKVVTLPDTVALVNQITAFETREDVQSRPIGRAYATVRGQPTSLTDMALGVRELAPSSTTGTQVGVAFGPLMLPNEKMVIARVLKVRQPGPPESLDQVKDAVVTDWKKLRAYELLKARVGEITDRVADEGKIDAVRALFTQSQLQVGVEVSRHRATLGNAADATVANTQAMRDAILDRVAGWDPTVDPATQPSKDRVVVQALPEQYGVGVGVITGRYPVTAEVLRTYLNVLRRQFNVDLRQPVLADSPFSLAQLKTQLGFKAPERAKPREGEGDEEPATPAPKKS